jgi:hypothetical protein
MRGILSPDLPLPHLVAHGKVIQVWVVTTFEIGKSLFTEESGEAKTKTNVQLNHQ